LHKGAGQLFQFPRRAGFAGAQANRDIFNPHRLAGFQHQVADDAIPLVEQAQHGDSLRHRGHPRLVRRRSRDVDGDRLVTVLIRLLGAVAPAHQGKQREGQQGLVASHAYSGFHAS